MNTALRSVRLTFPARAGVNRSGPSALHKFTMKALPAFGGENPRAAANLLWRTDQQGENAYLTIQADGREANLDQFERVEGVSEVSHASDVLERLGLEAGDHLRFQVRANATKSIAKRRVPITDDEEAAAWFARCGDGAFEVADFMAEVMDPVLVERPGGSLRFGVLDLRGVVQVTDAAGMETLLRTGIGRGKAFGLGLLQVAR